MLSRLNRPLRKDGGFTLVELLIVVVIIGILAAVGIPMYRGASDRAKASEAVSALGTVRSALRVWYAEKGEYPIHTDTVQVDSLGLDLSSNDLLGTFFDNNDYTYSSNAGGTTFLIIATGDTDPPDAPRASEVTGIVRTMDHEGTTGTE